MNKSIILLVCNLLFFLNSFLLVGNVVAESETTLDFIYVNANTGEAAGGHTAIRLGSTVFHFQFFPQGRFLLVRESWAHFRYVYNELRNRSIFISRVYLTPKIYAKLRSHFTGQLMAQQHNINQLLDAKTQQQLLAQLAKGSGQLEFEAIGLFNFKSIGDVDMHNLHQIILKKIGGDAILRIRKLAEKRLASLAIGSEQLADSSSWTTKLQGLLLEREFFRILQKGVSLAPNSVIESLESVDNLTLQLRQALEKYKQELEESIVGLIQSHRPDRAKSLLLQTARYLVVSRSLATNTLLALDPFSSRAYQVQVVNKDNLPALQLLLQQDVMRAQAHFSEETQHLSIAYTILESSLGRLHELEQGLRGRGLVRVERGMLLPARKGPVSVEGLSFGRVRLPALITANKMRLSKLQQQMDKKYTYDLIAQNCATELLRTLNSAFADKIVGQRELGGWLTPESAWVFIPSQFHIQVGKHFSILERVVLPSRRLRQLEAMYKNSSVFQVWLRESNTFSSTLYTPRVEDTPFLFFTDNILFMRPIFGLINFLWATANSFGGVFVLPIDGGEHFHQGLRGIFYSLPELVFSNIRKGTYGYAEITLVGP